MLSDFLITTAEDFFSFGVMVVVTLAVVITIHEFGHYVAARLCGVRVETFAFGFGKELFGFGGQDSSTRWSVRVFPLGGYVKLFGDVDKNNPIVWDFENDCERRLSDEELEASFCMKSVWQRMFIVAAGPLINIVLTYALLFSLFTLHGQGSRPPIINMIAQGSAAYDAGIKVGDKILEMDGQVIQRLRDVYDFTWYEDPPESHVYLVERDGQQIEIEFAARRLEYFNKKGVEKKHGQTGMVRVVAVDLKKGMHTLDGVDVKKNPDKAREIITQRFDEEIVVGVPFRGYGEDITADPFILKFPSEFNKHLFDPEDEDYEVAYLVDPEKPFYVQLRPVDAINRISFSLYEGVVGTYRLIEAYIAGRNSEAVVGGVAKISQKTGEAFSAGFYNYIIFISMFSFMIAFINLLPIPALDGGYLMFMLYEVATGRALPPRVQDLALIVGMAILLGIMIFANISDFLSLMFPVE